MDELVSNELAQTPFIQEAPAVEQGFTSGFTSDDLAKAREQEKAKLYPQLEKMKEELAEAKRRAEELAAREGDREAERQALEEARVAAQKAKEEDELSFKDLLKKKEEEFNAKIEHERLERERTLALLDQERKFQELLQYRANRIEEERDNIVPELIDLIAGNSADEVEQSIATLKDKSARIIESAQQAMTSARAQMAGTRITMPAAGPLDNDSENKSYTPDGIRDMSMDEYMKHRQRLLGSSANSRGQGLFN
jgi:hypothetical protein